MNHEKALRSKIIHLHAYLTGAHVIDMCLCLIWSNLQMITATSPRSCTHARTVKLNSRFLVQLEDFSGNCVMSQREERKSQ